MKSRILLLVLVTGIISGATGQNTFDLTFTAVDSAAYAQLDSVKVMNLTQGDETMIYRPDTMLSLEINQGDLLLYVGYSTFSTAGITEVNDAVSSFLVYQNYPNPMADRSEISMYIPHAGKVQVMITEIQGRVVFRTERQLDKGGHSFMFHPGGGSLYFLTAHWNGINRSIQMISTGIQDGKNCRLDYVGTQSGEPVLKNSLQVNGFFVRQSGMLDSPQNHTTYTFQFASNIPCPGTPTVEYEGQVYNTLQIFSQCWLKENLNVGIMISGNQNQNDNGVIEKYCYHDNELNCDNYGGLYQWNEMMGHSVNPGAQGICPDGWHIPTDDEWKVLEGAVDSLKEIGNAVWNIAGFRGYDSGKNLKSKTAWNAGVTGADLYGFMALPGGYRSDFMSFLNMGGHGFWWSSNELGQLNSWSRNLWHASGQSNRFDYNKLNGFSVRCLRDY